MKRYQYKCDLDINNYFFTKKEVGKLNPIN